MLKIDNIFDIKFPEFLFSELKNLPIGYIYEGDFEAFKSIVNYLPNEGTLVEIGCLMGRSSVLWAEIFRRYKKNYKIYCLDIFDYTPKTFLDSHLSSSFTRIGRHIKTLRPFINNDLNHYQMFKEITKDYKEIEPIIFDIFKNSPKDLNIDKVTCVFDDSVHNKEAALINLNNWFNRLEENGLYCGHDYSDNFPGLVDGITEFCYNNNLKVHTKKDSVTYYLSKKYE